MRRCDPSVDDRESIRKVGRTTFWWPAPCGMSLYDLATKQRKSERGAFCEVWRVCRVPIGSGDPLRNPKATFSRLVGGPCYLFLEFRVCARVVSIWCLPIGSLVEKGGRKGVVQEAQSAPLAICLCGRGSGLFWRRCDLVPVSTIPARK